MFLTNTRSMISAASTSGVGTLGPAPLGLLIILSFPTTQVLLMVEAFVSLGHDNLVLESL